jgi:hypothetical protein
MIHKEKNEITKLDIQNNNSKERVISSVQNNYTAIKIMSLNKHEADKEDLHNTVEKHKNESLDLLQSLHVDDTSQAMLATQMAAIHELQQMEFLFASRILSPEKKFLHINAITKLSNVFIQQATLMQKLQGKGQQKVTVEHVHVHRGGQAIVGNINTNSNRGGSDENKKG